MRLGEVPGSEARRDLGMRLGEPGNEAKGRAWKLG